MDFRGLGERGGREGVRREEEWKEIKTWGDRVGSSRNRSIGRVQI